MKSAKRTYVVMDDVAWEILRSYREHLEQRRGKPLKDGEVVGAIVTFFLQQHGVSLFENADVQELERFAATTLSRASRAARTARVRARRRISGGSPKA